MTKRKEIADRIPLDECLLRRLYRLRSRNLALGIFDGKTGFIGIRHKFKSKFLATEYHWDQGPPHGTVFGVEDTGIDLPEGIQLCESPGTYDQETDRPVAFDRPIDDGGRGWYFTDTDEASKDIRPVGKQNVELYDWLVAQDSDITD